MKIMATYEGQIYFLIYAGTPEIFIDFLREKEEYLYLLNSVLKEFYLVIEDQNLIDKFLTFIWKSIGTVQNLTIDFEEDNLREVAELTQFARSQNLL